MSFCLSSTNTVIAEYVWIGGKGELRSKSRVVTIRKEAISLADFSDWDYDGSSTDQGTTENSERILKPCALYKDPFRVGNSFLVLCSTFMPDGSPVFNNHRFGAEKIFKDCDKTEYIYDSERQGNKLIEINSPEPWFGLEQEYFIYGIYTKEPLGFGQAVKQGQYYCSVGGQNAFGRGIVDDHYKKCLEIGLGITGINAEVAPGQWEFQIFGKGIAAADNLVIARYLLERISEDFNAYIVWHPKPIKDSIWNGSGLHTNFSTKVMRDSYCLDQDTSEIQKAIAKLEEKHNEHMLVYGEDNDLRLTGNCETSSFSNFKRGLNNGDRSASIRMRHGYLEDRRPASNADPYLVCSKIYETVCLFDKN
jgi:glutamine synthetase